MSAESQESTVIQPKVMGTAHPKAFASPKIGSTGKIVMDNPTESEDECQAHNASDIEPGSGIKSWERPEHRVVSAALNVP